VGITTKTTKKRAKSAGTKIKVFLRLLLSFVSFVVNLLAQNQEMLMIAYNKRRAFLFVARHEPSHR
jgi:hypothetical protein